MLQKSSIILILAFISGICGLAYEIFYVNIISNYFGDMFYVSSAVLLTFFLGMGIGSLYANKFTKYLPFVEMGIGVYGVIITYLMYNYSYLLIEFSYMYDIYFPLFIVLLTIIILLIPSILLGISVPLYTKYYSFFKSNNSKNTFNNIYILYNLGGAICVLIIEYYLLREIGIFRGIISIALLNIFVGLILFFQTHNHKSLISFNKDSRLFSIKNLLTEIKTYSNIYTILIGINIITSIYYLIVLQLINFIFGPLSENFSILLFTSLIAISFSTIYLKYKKSYLNPQKLIPILLIISLVIFTLTYNFIYSWIFVLNYVNDSIFLVLLFKFLTIGIFFLPLFFVFGLVEPVIISSRDSQKQIGFILAISSFSMALGFILGVFLLFEFFKLQQIIVGMSLVLFIFYLSKQIKNFNYNFDYNNDNNNSIQGFNNSFKEFFKPSIKLVLFIILIISLLFLFNFNWPEKTLNLGYNTIQSPEELENRINSIESVEEYRKYQDSVSLIKFDNSQQWFSANGYVIFIFNNYSSNLIMKESSLALSTLPFIDNTSNFLTIGMGAGITAGAASLEFDNVDVVEINTAIKDIIQDLPIENYNLLEKDNVDIIYQDGLTHLHGTNKTYNVISNSIPTPYFYSASKLWTKESFELVESRLSEGGVYSAWFDSRLGEEGMYIIKETLESVFEDCKYYVVTAAYYFTICSNSELNFSQDFNHENLDDEIKEVFGEQRIYSIDEYIYNRFVELDFTHNGNFKPENKSYINTLDKQILKYKSQPISKYQGTEEFRAFFENFVISKIQTNPFTNLKLNESELSTKCYFLDHNTYINPNINKECFMKNNNN